jgi:CRISPR locus-related DNA-binding protein
MAVLFATLGHTPNLVLAPLRGNGTLASLHLFYGTPQEADGKRALAAARSACAGLGVNLAEHPVKNPWGYTNFLSAFTQAHATLAPGEQVSFNASGGTRVMVMAATIFCFTRDIPLLYYDEYQTKDGTVIPLRAFRNLDRLGDMPLAILRRLQGKGPADMSTLAHDMGLSPSTVTGHIQTLTDAGAVQVGRQGKRRVVTLVPDLASIQLGSTT